MDLLRIVATAGLVCLVASPSVYAEPPQNMSEWQLAISVRYFECVEPEEPQKRVVHREEDKKSVDPPCMTWRERWIGRTRLELDPSGYTYDTGIAEPRANIFVHDVNKAIYGEETVTNEFGFPATVGELFENPTAYGLVEIASDQERTGALVVSPTFGGVIVRHSGDGPEKVLYPSHKLRGELNEGDVNVIFGKEPTKYLVPRELTDLKSDVPPKSTSIEN